MLNNNHEKRDYQINWRELSRDWPFWLFWAATWAYGFLLYPRLPSRVPTHWNIQGQVDAYGDKFWAVLAMPLLAAAIYLLMLFLPQIDPKRQNYSRFSRAYRMVRVTISLFLVAVYLLTLLAASGLKVDISLFVPLFLGLMLMVMGNYFGQVKPNYFFGIRTPWTLADERVWRQTHRFSGFVWVAAGLLVVAGVFFSPLWRFVLVMTATLGAALISTLYSYLLFRRLNP
jgi:uncharacterized membrane protein